MTNKTLTLQFSLHLLVDTYLQDNEVQKNIGSLLNILGIFNEKIKIEVICASDSNGDELSNPYMRLIKIILRQEVTKVAAPLRLVKNTD